MVCKIEPKVLCEIASTKTYILQFNKCQFSNDQACVLSGNQCPLIFE